MGNMSYCRFSNTRLALDECIESLNDKKVLSNEEFKQCKKMFETFIYFCCDEGIIIDEGELDERLEEFFNNIEID